MTKTEIYYLILQSNFQYAYPSFRVLFILKNKFEFSTYKTYGEIKLSIT